MSIHKNYFATQSVTYHLQRCKIIPLESESGNEEGCFLDNVQFSTAAQFFLCSVFIPIPFAVMTFHHN